jgi:polyisoprenoid-binding protein YceI
MSTTAVEIPGYVAGTYTIDPGHSDVAFTVRHLMVSKVRGHVTRFQGELTLAPDPLASSVTATIELASIDTNNPQRDDDPRSANFFETDTYPTMTFRSVGICHGEDGFDVDGELTLHGVTRRSPWPWTSTASPVTPTAAPGPASRPLPSWAGATSASAPTSPWTAAGWSSATVSRSSSRSKPSSTHPGRPTPDHQGDGYGDRTPCHRQPAGVAL